LRNGLIVSMLKPLPRSRLLYTDWNKAIFLALNRLGQGVSEYKIDFAPGYRIYFGREGNMLVILLGGGSKKTQSKDIRNAQLLWAQYKTEKKRKRKK
jgi:putative addiction module killer protein